MRVAWVVYGALEQPTGGYVYDRLVIERLRARGADIDVVSIEPGESAKLEGTLRRSPPDVVVGDELCSAELAVAFAALPRSVASALLVHHLGAWELPPGDARDSQLAREVALVRAADAVVATSDFTVARLAADAGRIDVRVAFPGADRLPRRARRLPEGVALLFVGSYQPRKRLLELLAALDALALPEVTLTLVGDASRDVTYAARVREAVDRSPYLRARVVEAGVVPDGALADRLAAAHALVLPSSLEGYGMVLTEALHAGVPVLAAEGAAVPSCVGDGGASIVFEEGGEARSIHAFARDASLRERLAAAAARLAPALPTWDGAAAGVAATLDEALARCAAGA